VRVPTWLRVILPVLIIGVWFTAAGIGGPYFGKVSEVTSNDATAYLPSTAEATIVQQELSDFLGDDVIPAVVLGVSDRELDEEQLAALSELPAEIEQIDGVASTPSIPIPSEDGKAVQIFVPVDSTTEVGAAVESLRAGLADTEIAGVEFYVTGPAGFTGDLVEAFAGIDGLLLLVALGAVLVILVVVYRSPILPIVVLMTSVFALCAALLTVWWIAKSGALLLNGQIQGILFILVIGAATDYALLYVARYREALQTYESRWEATLKAIKAAFPAIIASGGTVIAGLLCLLLSQLETNRALGPIAAIGIAFAILSSLTLLPALLYATGRVAYWPRKPRYDGLAEGDHMPTKGLWAKLPGWISRRARIVWIVTVAVLAAAGLGMLQLKADGVPSSEFVLGESEARTGQQLLAEHFPGGSGSPVYVIVDEADMQSAADTMLASGGIDSVSVTVDSVSGSAPITEDGIGVFGTPGTPAPEPIIANGEVLLQATLAYAADSEEATEAVLSLRETFGDSAKVGGVTATSIDTNAASIHDRNLIIPLVLVVIVVILGLLLRSIVAPLVLIATVVLSFVATMGVSALVFNHILGLPGADPSVPLFGFVFLVALGIDYNIFLMERVRTEAVAHGSRWGMSRGLAITGGIITSAGLVLAATFAALSVIPILFLLQLAFIVAFGVLLDTFIVRTLLVPALGYDLGRRMWWPSRKITS